jgi:hypothetical protein
MRRRRPPPRLRAASVRRSDAVRAQKDGPSAANVPNAAVVVVETVAIARVEVKAVAKVVAVKAAVRSVNVAKATVSRAKTAAAMAGTIAKAAVKAVGRDKDKAGAAMASAIATVAVASPNARANAGRKVRAATNPGTKKRVRVRRCPPATGIRRPNAAVTHPRRVKDGKVAVAAAGVAAGTAAIVRNRAGSKRTRRTVSSRMI